MRISGLIRAFNSVRSQLQAGIRREAVESFRRRVTGIVSQVEEICEQHSVTPDRLPAPSRRAYLFLKGLELDNLPVIDGDGPVPRMVELKVKNILRAGEHFADRLWRHTTASSGAGGTIEETLENLRRQVSLIERLCADHQATPSILELPSRQVFCWLKFLSDEENLGLHQGALRSAQQALGEIGRRLDRPVQVHLVNMTNSLWHKRTYHHVLLLKVSEGFLNAGQDVWRALLQSALLQRDQSQARLVREFANSEDYSEVLIELESMAEPAQPSTQGRIHSLEANFDRVNASYFGGTMPKPVLVWNRMLTARKLGHYQPARDRVMLSVSLDDPTVPAWVVDFVMYHELLHKKHGVAMVNGRRVAHSPCFRADELLFKEYGEAKRHLEELALRQRGPHR